VHRGFSHSTTAISRLHAAGRDKRKATVDDPGLGRRPGEVIEVGAASHPPKGRRFFESAGFVIPALDLDGASHETGTTRRSALGGQPDGSRRSRSCCQKVRVGEVKGESCR